MEEEDSGSCLQQIGNVDDLLGDSWESPKEKSRKKSISKENWDKNKKKMKTDSEITINYY